MQTWKIVLAGIALSGASIFALAHNGPHHVAGDTKAVAARHAQSPQTTRPIKALEDATADNEYGWGPFRTTDW